MKVRLGQRQRAADMKGNYSAASAHKAAVKHGDRQRHMGGGGGCCGLLYSSGDTL